AVLLLAAHRALEALTLTQRELKFKAAVDREWAEMAYAGLWFDPLRFDLDAFIESTQRRVTGAVRLRLYKGGLVVQGRRSDWALYSEDLASFDSKTFDQRDSTGIVKTHGLQSRMWVARVMAAVASGEDPSALPPGASEIALDALPHGEA
ncbi:MAG: argininosuccinate synthase, partial [Armatimonadota bacterium]|nr:argininosuccinate synthase [Armatimonadota bacterium]